MSTLDPVSHGQGVSSCSTNKASESTSVGGRAGSQMWPRTKMLKAEGMMANYSGSGF